MIGGSAIGMKAIGLFDDWSSVVVVVTGSGWSAIGMMFSSGALAGQMYTAGAAAGQVR